MIEFTLMNTWAVIQTGGKQYKVSEGQTVAVEKLKAGDSGKVRFDKVLLVKQDNGITLGKPFIENAKILGKIIENFKDKKIKVVKFKSKSHYRRTQSHRQKKTRLLIEKIES